MSLVTLLTDFGSSDYYSALLKAAILSAAPQASLVDISHDIPAQDIMDGAFFLKSVAGRFPERTIHMALINTYYRQNYQLIAFEHKGQHFFGPNNGLFSLVYPELTKDGVYEVTLPGPNSIYESAGRVCQLIFNGVELDEIGRPIENLEVRLQLQPVITSNQIRATIIHVDHFGNVIINLDQSTFEKVREGRNYAIYYKSKDPIKQLSKGYHEAALTEVCAFFNEIDLLEIAINMGNAHQLLNLNKNETIQINFY